MAKIIRKTASIFGGGLSAGSHQVEQFGSKVQTGTPNYTVDPDILQSLSAWVNGWSFAIDGGTKAPYLQDMNAFCLVATYQIAYLLQQGIPEWNSQTNYYKGSYVQSTDGSGQRFISLQDNNTNHIPPPSASNAFWTWDNPPLPNTFGVGNAIKAGLSVQPNVGVPLSRIDVAFDLLSVQGVILTSLAFTANKLVNGANGLDVGAPAASTWYAIHVITNDTASLTASLLSLSATGPTLPVGYTKFRRVGWVRNNAGGNFIQYTTVGDWIYYVDATQASFTLASGSHPGTSFAVYMPPTSRLVTMNANLESNTGTPAFVQMAVTGSSQAPVEVFGVPGNSGATVNLGFGSASMFATNVNQQIDMIVQTFFTVATFKVLGYYDPV